LCQRRYAPGSGGRRDTGTTSVGIGTSMRSSACRAARAVMACAPLMSLLSRVLPRGNSGFGYGSTASDVARNLDLRGRTLLVTGGNSGIGLETVRALAARGARVIATGRTREKVAEAVAGLSGEILPLACDLADPSSVRAAASSIKEQGLRANAVICNAGIMALPELTQAFGYELQFFTNHIGHFSLVTSLLDHVADDARFVIVSSNAHRRAPPAGIEFDNLHGERGYDPWTAYGQSKLANLLFTKELAKRLSGTRKTANAVHPGVIRTNLTRNMHGPFTWALAAAEPLVLKTIPEGAATQCYVAVHPDAAGITGEYFSHCNIQRPTALARDAALAARLWQESERIVASLP
jgi:NAD(P)-dependent dehydrogenase (short-subunit alcohol dehydrogenase family)